MKNKRNEEINNLTKESIAIATAELVMSSSPCSVTEICKKAGVSRNAYYRNFDSVDDVIIYYIIMNWGKYCENNEVTQENQEEFRKHLIRFFYTERELMKELKRQNKVYLVENLFRLVIIPKDVASDARYSLYVLAYAVYGVIRAMIDNDFIELPEGIVIR